jgi:multiple sugar transport system permease protein
VSRRRELLVLLALAVYASPVAWQLLTSITPSQELQQGARLWPSHPTLASYAAVFTQSPLPRALVNSIGVALATTFLGTVLGTLGAYALARLAIPGRRALVLGILMTTALPAIATVGPLYLTMRALGLRDTWGAVIIAHTSIALPLMLWLMARFLRALPRELEDAAFVDGAGRLQALRHVVVPAAAPGIASAAVVTFLLSWNEFLFAYTFTATEASRTAPVALALFPGVFEVPWGDIAAASILAALPPIVIVVVLQRHLVRGLLAGSLKD